MASCPAQADCLYCVSTQVSGNGDCVLTYPLACTETGCSSQLFTAPGTQNYNIKVIIRCPSGNCTKCEVCATVFDLDGNQIRYINTEDLNLCGMNDCGTQATAFTLWSGQQYRLCVCMKPCHYPINNSSNCTNICTARACVYRDGEGCTP
jgi:hypothetical protein